MVEARYGLSQLILTNSMNPQDIKKSIEQTMQYTVIGNAKTGYRVYDRKNNELVGVHYNHIVPARKLAKELNN